MLQTTQPTKTKLRHISNFCKKMFSFVPPRHEIVTSSRSANSFKGPGFSRIAFWTLSRTESAAIARATKQAVYNQSTTLSEYNLQRQTLRSQTSLPIAKAMTLRTQTMKAANDLNSLRRDNSASLTSSSRSMTLCSQDSRSPSLSSICFDTDDVDEFNLDETSSEAETVPIALEEGELSTPMDCNDNYYCTPLKSKSMADNMRFDFPFSVAEPAAVRNMSSILVDAHSYQLNYVMHDPIFGIFLGDPVPPTMFQANPVTPFPQTTPADASPILSSVYSSSQTMDLHRYFGLSSASEYILPVTNADFGRLSKGSLIYLYGEFAGTILDAVPSYLRDSVNPVLTGPSAHVATKHCSHSKCNFAGKIPGCNVVPKGFIEGKHIHCNTRAPPAQTKAQIRGLVSTHINIDLPHQKDYKPYEMNNPSPFHPFQRDTRHIAELLKLDGLFSPKFDPACVDPAVFTNNVQEACDKVIRLYHNLFYIQQRLKEEPTMDIINGLCSHEEFKFTIEPFRPQIDITDRYLNFSERPSSRKRKHGLSVNIQTNNLHSVGFRFTNEHTALLSTWRSDPSFIDIFDTVVIFPRDSKMNQ